MVTEAIVSALIGILQGLVSPLPTMTVDASTINTQATSAGALASAMNGYAPVQTLGVALALVFGVKVALLGWQVVVWIYHQFWGSN